MLAAKKIMLVVQHDGTLMREVQYRYSENT